MNERTLQLAELEARLDAMVELGELTEEEAREEYRLASEFDDWR